MIAVKKYEMVVEFFLNGRMLGHTFVKVVLRRDAFTEAMKSRAYFKALGKATNAGLALAFNVRPRERNE